MDSFLEQIHGKSDITISRQISLLPATRELSEGFNLDVGIAAMELFVRENFTGPSSFSNFPRWAQAKETIHIDGEPTSPLAVGIPLLLYAKQVFDAIMKETRKSNMNTSSVISCCRGRSSKSRYTLVALAVRSSHAANCWLG